MPGSGAETGAGLYHAAIMRRSRYSDHAGSRSGWYATQISNQCERRRSRAEHEAETEQKKVRKASQATPIRNPPITIHIIHLVSAIPPPLLLFSSLSQKFFLTKNSCSIITYTEVRYDK